MVNRCVVFGCSNVSSGSVSIFKCPDEMKRIWIRFVNRTRAKWSAKNIYICSAHFTHDQFENWQAHELGFQNRLLLKKNAIQTVYPDVSSSRCKEGPSTLPLESIQTPETQDTEMENVDDDPDLTETPKLRGAYRKREIQRILYQYNDSVSENEEYERENPLKMVDASTQTEAIIVIKETKSVKCQSSIRPKSRSIGIMTKPDSKEIAVDCKILKKGYKAVTPEKLEFSSDEECIRMDSSDVSYQPSINSDISLDTSNDRIAHDEAKFIVYKSCLFQLFENCCYCGDNCQVNITNRIGTYIKITQLCHRCKSHKEWASQPILNNIPAGNISLSASILFTGGSPTKIFRLFNIMNVACHTVSTYHKHARLYLHPTVYGFWLAHKMDLVEELRRMGGPLEIGGDGRADSPGHSAKYGSYTLMELRLNKVIDIELVQSNEVGGSNNMELEGLIRALDYLEQENLEWSSFISDRHLQIAKWIRTIHPGKDHWNDTWHVAKGNGKKIDKLSKLKECEVVKTWKKSITNHMYWVAMTSGGNGDLAEAKWKSLASHIQNVHVGHEDPLFSECAHPPIDENGRRKRWLQPGTKACEKLVELILNKRLVSDVRRLSPHHQTSGIEGFHSVIIHFCPKSTVFSYKAMLIRLCLAAIHYNWNSSRRQAITCHGQLRYVIKYPKYKKGEYRVEKVKETANFGYAAELMHLLCTDVVYNPQNYAVALDAVETPPDLCAGLDHPNKKEAVGNYVSRFI